MMTMSDPKLFLYSLALSKRQAEALTSLAGKDARDMKFAIIENAADVIANAIDWLGGFRAMLQDNGYQLELLDLRDWTDDKEALYRKLASKDVIWLGGGNTFYLRWILKESGADVMIRELVRQGKIYAGWSAGAVVAGPTLRYFEPMDNTNMTPQLITDGLHLTETVVVPHLDNIEFSDDAKEANEHLTMAGYRTIALRDDQVLMINGDQQVII